MFNEQKRYELNVLRLQSDVHRGKAVNLRMKIQELRDERNDRQRLFDGAESEVKQRWRNMTPPSQTYDPYWTVAEEQSMD